MFYLSSTFAPQFCVKRKRTKDLSTLMPSDTRSQHKTEQQLGCCYSKSTCIHEEQGQWPRTVSLFHSFELICSVLATSTEMHRGSLSDKKGGRNRASDSADVTMMRWRSISTFMSCWPWDKSARRQETWSFTDENMPKHAWGRMPVVWQRGGEETIMEKTMLLMQRLFTCQYFFSDRLALWEIQQAGKMANQWWGWELKIPYCHVTCSVDPSRCLFTLTQMACSGWRYSYRDH